MYRFPFDSCPAGGGNRQILIGWARDRVVPDWFPRTTDPAGQSPSLLIGWNWGGPHFNWDHSHRASPPSLAVARQQRRGVVAQGDGAGPHQL